MRPMPEGLGGEVSRPLEETYWILPGRLLVGEHPGSRSRAQAMDRIRSFLGAGITCFIDLTEPDETPSYEFLLPEKTARGRHVVYLRDPIVDHGLPDGAEQMARIIGSIDDALADGHNVYLHCRAGIGRSALAAGCWLAEKRGNTQVALDELTALWQESAQARMYERVPETDEQVQYLRRWLGPLERPVFQAVKRRAAPVDYERRLRGAWYGLALGDAMGGAGMVAAARKAETAADDEATATLLAWSQPTALALGLAHSLLELQRFDARDQIERYLRWQREGYCAADGRPGETQVTADVSKALATYLWRKQPMAGSHDPKDAAATSLPRVLATVAFAVDDAAGAIGMAAESARTTQQSPVLLDSCRFFAAMIACAFQGRPADTWLKGVAEPVPGAWQAKALRKDIVAMATGKALTAAQSAAVPEVVHVLGKVRRSALEARDFDDAVARACASSGRSAALHGALAGMLFGLRHGHDALPADRRSQLLGREQLDALVERFMARRQESSGNP